MKENKNEKRCYEIDNDDHGFMIKAYDKMQTKWYKWMMNEGEPEFCSIIIPLDLEVWPTFEKL